MVYPLALRIVKMVESATLQMTAKARKLKQEGNDVINLSIGEPDFDTPQFIKELAWEGLEGAERPSMSMRLASKGLAIGWGEPPRGSHANLETAGEEFA